MRITFVTDVRTIETTVSAMLDACVRECQHHAMEYGHEDCSFSFHFDRFKLVYMDNEQVRKSAVNFLNKELPLRLPGVDFKFSNGTSYRHFVALEVQFSWK